MKIYIAAGIAIVSLVFAVSTALVLSQQDLPAPQPQTTVSSSTQATDDASVDSSSQGVGKQESDATETTTKTTATYTKFSTESFREANGDERILFFYDANHLPSKRVDEMLTTNLKELPDKLHVFKANFAEQKELGEQFGVTQPGASLKFDANTQLSAVYIATENPDIATYKKVLSLK